MYLLGDKKIFAMELSKDTFACQLRLYIDGKDILQFRIQGNVYPHRWRNFNAIQEWFQNNLGYILQDDELPLEASEGKSAVDLCEPLPKFTYDMDLYEKVQSWMFRHSWFTARDAAFLADVYFRRVKDKIEISWDNRETFKEEGAEYIYPRGKFYVEPDLFRETIKGFISACDQLK